MEELHRLYGIDKSRTTPYHPQGNGACERFNRTLLQMLRALEQDQKARWPEYVSDLVWVYNNRVHQVTGRTPYEVVFGRPGKGMTDLELSLEEEGPRTGMASWVRDHRHRLQTLHRLVHTRIREVEHRSTPTAKPPEFRPGDRVLVREQRPQNKLDHRWEKTPYRVLRRIDPHGPVYEVQSEALGSTGTRILHRNMLRLCRSVDSDTPESAIREEPPTTESPNNHWWDEEDDEEERRQNTPPISTTTLPLTSHPSADDIPPTPPTQGPEPRRSERSTAGRPPTRYSPDLHTRQTQVWNSPSGGRPVSAKASPRDWRAYRVGECRGQGPGELCRRVEPLLPGVGVPGDGFEGCMGSQAHVTGGRVTQGEERIKSKTRESRGREAREISEERKLQRSWCVCAGRSETCWKQGENVQQTLRAITRAPKKRRIRRQRPPRQRGSADQLRDSITALPENTLPESATDSHGFVSAVTDTDHSPNPPQKDSSLDWEAVTSDQRPPAGGNAAPQKTFWTRLYAWARRQKTPPSSAIRTTALSEPPRQDYIAEPALISDRC
ncbi:uncharacterized protein LOC143767094 [Ranitomeya variabilis]|uniref:uncharacterized protein LOC143767094 n=1 Tax=Ranitomeya variabilis TaxID=490064 RepID=UPI004057AF90